MSSATHGQRPTAAEQVSGAPLALPPIKGRGTVWAIEHRFSSVQREAFDDGWGTLDQTVHEQQLRPDTQVIEEHVRSILSANESPDIGFDRSINPYRGCEHGCVYCYARPTHSYLNLSPGIDFETHIVAKVNAAQRLREALARPGYTPMLLNLGSITDCYQPVERRLRITRSIIEVLSQCRHAFSMFTKSAGIERDLDLIAPMAAQGLVGIHVTITTLDAQLARTMEPRATSPQRRLKTIEALARAGVPVGVSVSPMIPFLNLHELEHILEAARDAGASAASSIVLRLPWEVSPLFQQWLQQHVPDKAARVMARVREMRGGKDNDPRFGTRMTGTGIWAQLIRQRFDKARTRLGFERSRFELDLSKFTPPPPQPGQASLF